MLRTTTARRLSAVPCASDRAVRLRRALPLPATEASFDLEAFCVDGKCAPEGEGELLEPPRSELQYREANRPWRWMAGARLHHRPGRAALHRLLGFAALSRLHASFGHLPFGFIRRALVGTVLSAFTDAVPFWYVYALAIAAWIVTLVLFVAVFRKVFGFEGEFSAVCLRDRFAVLFQEFRDSRSAISIFTAASGRSSRCSFRRERFIRS